MESMERKRDNIQTPGGWALLVGPDGDVGLHLPVEDGHGRWVNIPAADFEALARWYLTGEKPSTPEAP